MSKSRKDISKDTRYSYFAVDDPILHLLRDADWANGERFLPRSEPTAHEKESLAKRRVGLEAVNHDEHGEEDASWPFSRTTTRVSQRLVSRARSRISSRLSTGSKIPLRDYMPILVAANNSDHPDEFWTKNATILDSIDINNQTLQAQTADSRAAARTGTRSVLHTSVARGGAGGMTKGSNRADTFRRSGTFTGGVRGASGGGGGGELDLRADNYGLATLESRYSSTALAAASRILLQL